MSVHDGGRSQPGKTQPRSRMVIARRMPTGQRLVCRPTSRTSLVGAEHDPVGAGVAGRLGGDGGSPAARSPRRGSGRGPRRRRAPGASPARRDRRAPRPAARTPAGPHAGVAVVCVAQRPVDAGVEDGFDEVGVVGANSPSTRSQPSNVREMCSRLTSSSRRTRRRRVRLGGVGCRLEPVAGGHPEVLGVQPLGLLQPGFVVLGGEGRGSGGRSRRSPAGARRDNRPASPARRRPGAAPTPRPAARSPGTVTRGPHPLRLVQAAANNAPSPPSHRTDRSKCCGQRVHGVSNCSVSRTAAPVVDGDHQRQAMQPATTASMHSDTVTATEEDLARSTRSNMAERTKISARRRPAANYRNRSTHWHSPRLITTPCSTRPASIAACSIRRPRCANIDHVVAAGVAAPVEVSSIRSPSNAHPQRETTAPRPQSTADAGGVLVEVLGGGWLGGDASHGASSTVKETPCRPLLHGHGAAAGPRTRPRRRGPPSPSGSAPPGPAMVSLA